MSKIPDLTPRKVRERQVRDERLARALRENLKRRKEQARAQTAGPDETAEQLTSSSGTSLSDRPLSSKNTDHGVTTAD